MSTAAVTTTGGPESCITMKSVSVGNSETSNDRFSNFGDEACGEPLISQNLLIDFTPDVIIDNDFVQKKICAFWSFIDSTPEIQNLVVKPEREKNVTPPSMITQHGSLDSKSELEQEVDKGRTAVSMLEFVEEKGLIDRTFEAKLPQSLCTLGSREYKESEPTQKKKKYAPCECTKICDPCPGLSEKPLVTLPALTKTGIMCKMLHQWGKKHPKSMLPPGHAPSLQHCILQRQVFQ